MPSSESLSPAAYALTGVGLGAMLTFLVNWLLKRQEVRLRLIERIMDRRIDAHENAIRLAKAMRTTTSVGGVDSDGELVRAPTMFRSLSEFQGWFATHSALFGEISTWLSPKITRELNFVQDYLVNLNETVHAASDQRLMRVGELVRQDFVSLSAGLERMAYQYFESGLTSLRIGTLTRRHKYYRWYTIRRLRRTVLFAKGDQIRRLLTQD